MKTIGVAMLLVFAASNLFASGAQADQIKKKAKDLKRNIEAGQTNGAKTNTPPRVR